MDTVLEVDLESRVRAVVIADDLVDPGRAVPLRRFRELRQVAIDRNIGIGQLQVRRLAFFVVSRAETDIGQPVKRQNSVWFGVFDNRVIGRLAG